MSEEMLKVNKRKTVEKIKLWHQSQKELTILLLALKRN